MHASVLVLLSQLKVTHNAAKGCQSRRARTTKHPSRRLAESSGAVHSCLAEYALVFVYSKVLQCALAM